MLCTLLQRCKIINWCSFLTLSPVEQLFIWPVSSPLCRAVHAKSTAAFSGASLVVNPVMEANDPALLFLPWTEQLLHFSDASLQHSKQHFTGMWNEWDLPLTWFTAVPAVHAKAEFLPAAFAMIWGKKWLCIKMFFYAEIMLHQNVEAMKFSLPSRKLCCAVLLCSAPSWVWMTVLTTNLIKIGIQFNYFPF